MKAFRNGFTYDISIYRIRKKKESYLSFVTSRMMINDECEVVQLSEHKSLRANHKRSTGRLLDFKPTD